MSNLKYNKADIESHADGHYHYSAFYGTTQEAFIHGARHQYNLMKPTIDKILSLLNELSQPNETIKTIEAQNEYTWERSEGHSQDCFSDGQSQAYADVALQVRKLLGEVK